MAKKKAVKIPSRVEAYSYRVFWSDEDAAFVATVDELPGLSGIGDTQEEALKELRVAVGVGLEWIAEEGGSIPEPLGKRVYSGKFNLRLPPEHHRALALEAARQGLSLNQLITLKLNS